MKLHKNQFIHFVLFLLLSSNTHAYVIYSPGVYEKHCFQKIKSNPLSRFFKNANIQCEDDEQRKNILNALEDALALPVDTLKTRRYADYTGQRNKWDYIELIEAHFSSGPYDPWADKFYDYIKLKSTQEQVRRMVNNIKKQLTDN